ncbi:MAG: hypothetical protein AAFV95_14885 [Bacteroidota bacterium]
MEELLNDIQFSWTDLLLISLALVGFYFLLGFLRKIISNTTVLGRSSRTIKDIIATILLIYEPMVLLVVGTVFLLINPLFHGVILLVLLLSTFPYVKNYTSGRIVQFDPAIRLGNRLGTRLYEGVIAETGRLGLRLRNSEGLHFITYSNLLTDGYSLLASEEIGGYYRLRIKAKDSESKIDHELRLRDLMATNPFLDWNHRPELRLVDNEEATFLAKILVKEDSHLSDMVSLIREWGYQCTTAENK